MMISNPPPDWMQAALDGELSPAEQAQFERQIAESPEARAQWLALVEVTQLLGAAPLAAPRPGFSKRFQARLAGRRSRTRLLGGMLALGLAAPVGMVILVLLIIGKLLPTMLIAPSPAAWLSAQATAIALSLADARAIVEALATSVFAVAGPALSHPLTWVGLTFGGVIVIAWFHLIRKTTWEITIL